MSQGPDYHGVLFDVDGTLLSNDQPIPGAAEAIERLRVRGVPFRVGTNTTRRPRSAVAGVLQRGGLRVEVDEILNPAVLARRCILDSGRTRAALLVPPGAREDFAGITDDETRPDWVVLGDLGRGFTFQALNWAYRWLAGGARLIALHKNRAWDNGVDGVVLDVGAYVAALEYAAQVEAELVGKPSRRFFELAVAEIGLAPGEVLVVGDDLEADCRGGAAAGCLTALVLTGRTTRAALDASGFKPDRVCDSIADLTRP